MDDDNAEIQSILEKAQRLASTVPHWVLRVEQINKEQSSRSERHTLHVLPIGERNQRVYTQ